MADNTSFEEVVQRLQGLLERNSRVEIKEERADGTAIMAGNIEFTIPRSTPNVIHQSISRNR